MTASWHLKVDRAEYHFGEFEREFRRYSHADPYPYRAERRPIKRKGQVERWRFVLRIDQPDPELRERLALILGDFAHNLRSSLDHLAAALVPSSRRSQAYFPILTRDLWKRDANRRYLVRDREARKSFDRATRGMSPKAIEVIKRLQPYQRTTKSFVGHHELSIISRLDNADKHRRLIPYIPHLNGAHWLLRVPAQRPKRGFVQGPLEDEAELFTVRPEVLGLQADDAVQVEINGTPLIAVEIGDEKLRLPINVVLIAAAAMSHLRRVVFPSLEPFVRQPVRGD